MRHQRDHHIFLMHFLMIFIHFFFNLYSRSVFFDKLHKMLLDSVSVLPLTSDPSSIYYIHPSDTSSQLVSIKFKGDGYGDWRRCMLIALSAKNKVAFVDGSLPKPSSDFVECKPWERFNDLIISWLLFNLDTTIAKSVLYSNIAREIWKDLEDRYGQTSGPQLYALEHQLSEIAQGIQNIAEFYTSIKRIWDEIHSVYPLPSCICNLTQKIHKMQQEQRLIQFLMKLSDDFSNVRSNVLMMQPLPSVNQAYRLLVQEQ
ncbi:uncharacterized protein LOC130821771 [Amaranthus tricolor]|uniref:uncharacterized protein LOC130821771 n=1 Tax=Amaranthus tricolor TaxID=29722 RepID=UPI00258866D2|nr:uncharacterized protein LOC130821771 [Amaranthus tricolor]